VVRFIAAASRVSMLFLWEIWAGPPLTFLMAWAISGFNL
jgi:hypothetical protein